MCATNILSKLFKLFRRQGYDSGVHLKKAELLWYPVCRSSTRTEYF